MNQIDKYLINTWRIKINEETKWRFFFQVSSRGKIMRTCFFLIAFSLLVMENYEPAQKKSRTEVPIFEFVPILSDNELAICEIINAYAIEVENPKLISQLLLEIRPMYYPVFEHLKAVKKISTNKSLLLVCEKNPLSSQVGNLSD